MIETAVPPSGPLSNTTGEKLLATAVRMFSERGFDGVTTREITFAAGANLAAIGYHFGSKQKLIAAAFSAVVRPISEARLRLLDEVLGHAGAARPSLDGIVRALVEPVVRGPGREALGTYHRFHLLAYALRRPFVDEIMSAEHDRVAVRFVEAIALALPEVRTADIWWRFDFAVGALVHIMLDGDRGHRLKHLSAGSCRTDDPESILSALVSSVVGSFTTATRPASETASMS